MYCAIWLSEQHSQNALFCAREKGVGKTHKTLLYSVQVLRIMQHLYADVKLRSAHIRRG